MVFTFITLGLLTLITKFSRFSKFQEIYIQDDCSADDCLTPRSIRVLAMDRQTGQVNTGDHIEVYGIFLPLKKEFKDGLCLDTYVQPMKIIMLDKSGYQNEDYLLTENELNILMNENEIFEKMSKSIMPEIHGHSDLKKALLLLLIGAPENNLGNGIKIRGNIHMLICGDPGNTQWWPLKPYIVKYLFVQDSGGHHCNSNFV